MKKKEYTAPQTGAESLTGWQLMGPNIVSPTVNHNQTNGTGIE